MDIQKFVRVLLDRKDLIESAIESSISLGDKDYEERNKARLDEINKVIDYVVYQNNAYYFIDSSVNPDTIYGDQAPHCITMLEIERLSKEWEEPNLMDKFHEATPEEIAAYGVYDY